MAVKNNECVGYGTLHFEDGSAPKWQPVNWLSRYLDDRWQRLSAGDGSKVAISLLRLAGWLPISRPPCVAAPCIQGRWLAWMRRSIAESSKDPGLLRLLRQLGTRAAGSQSGTRGGHQAWIIEDAFKDGHEQEVGLTTSMRYACGSDWCRHITLHMLLAPMLFLDFGNPVQDMLYARWPRW